MRKTLVEIFGGRYYEKKNDTTYWTQGRIRNFFGRIRWKVFNRVQSIKYGILYRYYLTVQFLKKLIIGIPK